MVPRTSYAWASAVLLLVLCAGLGAAIVAPVETTNGDDMTIRIASVSPGNSTTSFSPASALHGPFDNVSATLEIGAFDGTGGIFHNFSMDITQGDAISNAAVMGMRVGFRGAVSLDACIQFSWFTSCGASGTGLVDLTTANETHWFGSRFARMECEAEWLTADQLEDFYIGVTMVNLCASDVDVTLDGVEVDLYYVETSGTGSEQAVWVDPLHGSNDCHLHVCDSLEAAAKAAAADPALNAVFVYPDVYTGANNTDVSMRGLLLAGLLDPAADASALTRPIIDGQYADVRILEVLPSTTMTVRWMEFSNTVLAKEASGGCLSLAAADIARPYHLFDRVWFTSCTVKDGGGGAVAVTNAAVDLNDVHFEGCRVFSSNGDLTPRRGGALLLDGGGNVPSRLSACTFSGVGVTGSVAEGGAVWVSDSPLFSLSGVVVDGSQAEGSLDTTIASLNGRAVGGAVYAHETNLTVAGCSFSNVSISAVSSRVSGGVIHATGAAWSSGVVMSVKSDTVIDNVTASSAHFSVNGGVINVEFLRLSVADTTVANVGVSAGNGGMVYGGLVRAHTAIFVGTRIDASSVRVTADLGIVYGSLIQSYETECRVSHSTFSSIDVATNGTASQAVGGIEFSGSEAGSMHLDDPSMYINNVTFAGLTTSSMVPVGMAIRANGPRNVSVLSVADSAVVDSTARVLQVDSFVAVGGFMAYFTCTSGCQTVVSNTLFKDNTVINTEPTTDDLTLIGGLVFSLGEVSCVGNLFVNTLIELEGRLGMAGGVWGHYSGPVTVNDTVFENTLLRHSLNAGGDTAAQLTGPVFTTLLSSAIAFHNVTVANSTVDGVGRTVLGALFLAGDQVEIGGLTLRDCTVKVSGEGAVDVGASGLVVVSRDIRVDGLVASGADVTCNASMICKAGVAMFTPDNLGPAFVTMRNVDISDVSLHGGSETLLTRGGALSIEGDFESVVLSDVAVTGATVVVPGATVYGGVVSIEAVAINATNVTIVDAAVEGWFVRGGGLAASGVVEHPDALVLLSDLSVSNVSVVGFAVVGGGISTGSPLSQLLLPYSHGDSRPSVDTVFARVNASFNTVRFEAWAGGGGAAAGSDLATANITVTDSVFDGNRLLDDAGDLGTFAHLLTGSSREAGAAGLLISGAFEVTIGRVSVSDNALLSAGEATVSGALVVEGAAHVSAIDVDVNRNRVEGPGEDGIKPWSHGAGGVISGVGQIGIVGSSFSDNNATLGPTDGASTNATLVYDALPASPCDVGLDRDLVSMGGELWMTAAYRPADPVDDGVEPGGFLCVFRLPREGPGSFVTAVAVDGVGDGDGFGEAIAFHREAAGVLASPVVAAVGAPLALDERGAIFMVVLSPNLSIIDQWIVNGSHPSLSFDPGAKFGCAISLADADEVGAVVSACGLANVIWLDIDPNNSTGEVALDILHVIDGPDLLGAGVAEGFGASVAVVGDLTGDGISEVAIGAPYAVTGRGVVYVVNPVSGSEATWPPIELGPLASDLGLGTALCSSRKHLVASMPRADDGATARFGLIEVNAGEFAASIGAIDVDMGGLQGGKGVGRRLGCLPDDEQVLAVAPDRNNGTGGIERLCLSLNYPRCADMVANGGGLAISDVVGVVSISDTDIDRNTLVAPYGTALGGGLAADSIQLLNLTDVSLTSNRVSVADADPFLYGMVAAEFNHGGAGGGLAVTASNSAAVVLQRVTVNGNAADRAAGVLAVEMGNIAFASSPLTGNTARFVAGGAYIGGSGQVDSTNLTLSSVEIARNNAGTAVGGIEINGGVVLRLVDAFSTISNNTVAAGAVGGLACNEGSRLTNAWLAETVGNNTANVFADMHGMPYGAGCDTSGLVPSVKRLVESWILIRSSHVSEYAVSPDGMTINVTAATDWTDFVPLVRPSFNVTVESPGNAANASELFPNGWEVPLDGSPVVSVIFNQTVPSTGVTLEVAAAEPWVLTTGTYKPANLASLVDVVPGVPHTVRLTLPAADPQTDMPWCCLHLEVVDVFGILVGDAAVTAAPLLSVAFVAGDGVGTDLDVLASASVAVSVLDPLVVAGVGLATVCGTVDEMGLIPACVDVVFATGPIVGAALKPAPAGGVALLSDGLSLGIEFIAQNGSVAWWLGGVGDEDLDGDGGGSGGVDDDAGTGGGGGGDGDDDTGTGGDDDDDGSGVVAGGEILTVGVATNGSFAPEVLSGPVVGGRATVSLLPEAAPGCVAYTVEATSLNVPDDFEPAVTVTLAGFPVDSVVCFHHAGSVVLTTTQLTFDEDGGANLTVTLHTNGGDPELWANVTVPVVLLGGGSAEATLSASAFEFASGVRSGTADASQTIRIDAIDDAVDDGDASIRINVGPAASGDIRFDGMRANATFPAGPGGGPLLVSAKVIDNDVAGLDVVGPLTVSEEQNVTLGGLGVAALNVSLASQPRAPVTVVFAVRPGPSATEGELVDGDGDGAAVVGSVTLTWTVSGWNEAKTLYVRGVDDALIDGIAECFVDGEAESADDAYDGQNHVITLINADNDTLDPFQTSLVVGVPSEAGGTASISVALSARPLAGETVSLSIAVSDARVELSTASVVFGSANWSRPVTAVLSMADDIVAEASFDLEVTVGVVGGTHTESRFVTVVDDDLPGMVVQAGPSLANPPRADGHVSELGARAIGTVRLTAQPVGSVTVALTSSDSSEGVVVGPSSVAFSGADWDTAKTFTVGGVGDGTDADGDATFSVVASATGSGDPLWAATAPAASASFVNDHIFVPVVDGSDPLLSPLLGWEVTLSGRYLLPNATVTFGGAAGNLTVLDDAEGPGTETFAATGVVTYRSAVVTTPVLAATAYVDVVWTNPDGGTAPLDAAFYYTEDCPYEGQWGRGLDCVDCPVGAECPGGYRLWPLPGYWSPNETSGFVEECSAPAAVRCLGGQESVCGDGYTGVYCASCAAGFFSQGDICAECASTAGVVVILLANAAFYGLFIFACFALAKSRLSTVVTVITFLQLVRAVGRMNDGSMPSFVQKFYHYYSLLTMDLETLQPGCTAGSGDFASVFWGNMMIPAMCAAVLAGGLALLARCRLRKRVFYTNRLPRSFIILWHMSYLNVAIRAMQGVNCRRLEDGALRLVEEMTQECYTGSHLAVGVTSWFILLAGLVTYPIAAVAFLRRRKQRMTSDPVFVDRFGYLFEMYKPDVFWVGVCFLAANFVLAVVGVFGKDVPLLQLGVVCAMATAFAVLIITRRPFRDGWKNVVAVVIWVVACIQLLVNFISTLGVENSDLDGVINVLAWVVVVLVSLAVMTVMFACLQNSARALGRRCGYGEADADGKPLRRSGVYEESDSRSAGSVARTGSKAWGTATRSGTESGNESVNESGIDSGTESDDRLVTASPGRKESSGENLSGPFGANATTAPASESCGPGSAPISSSDLVDASSGDASDVGSGDAVLNPAPVGPGDGTTTTRPRLGRGVSTGAMTGGTVRTIRQLADADRLASSDGALLGGKGGDRWDGNRSGGGAAVVSAPGEVAMTGFIEVSEESSSEHYRERDIVVPGEVPAAGVNNAAAELAPPKLPAAAALPLPASSSSSSSLLSLSLSNDDAADDAGSSPVAPVAIAAVAAGRPKLASVRRASLATRGRARRRRRSRSKRFASKRVMSLAPGQAGSTGSAAAAAAASAAHAAGRQSVGASNRVSGSRSATNIAALDRDD